MLFYPKRDHGNSKQPVSDQFWKYLQEGNQIMVYYLLDEAQPSCDTDERFLRMLKTRCQQQHEILHQIISIRRLDEPNTSASAFWQSLRSIFADSKDTSKVFDDMS
jgi:hypothetical protein